MKALISPNEKVYSYDGIFLGFRVAEVSNSIFDVASPLFWVDCPDECAADQWYYFEDQLYIKPEPPPLPEEPEEPSANTP